METKKEKTTKDFHARKTRIQWIIHTVIYMLRNIVLKKDLFVWLEHT